MGLFHKLGVNPPEADKSIVNEISQVILRGISIVCGLVALGFVLIFKATEVINFAQGEMMLRGSSITYTLISLFKFPHSLH